MRKERPLREVGHPAAKHGSPREGDVCRRRRLHAAGDEGTPGSERSGPFAEARLKSDENIAKGGMAQAKQSRARADKADFDAPFAGKGKPSVSLQAEQQPHCVVTSRRRHSDQDAPPPRALNEHAGELCKRSKRISRLAAQRKKVNLVSTEAGNDSEGIQMRSMPCSTRRRVPNHSSHALHWPNNSSLNRPAERHGDSPLFGRYQAPRRSVDAAVSAMTAQPVTMTCHLHSHSSVPRIRSQRHTQLRQLRPFTCAGRRCRAAGRSSLQVSWRVAHSAIAAAVLGACALHVVFDERGWGKLFISGW